MRDSAPERLSTTAFPIISLFSIINELHPRQANIVVDACHAGGASFDLNQLSKPEVVGSSEASSIAFLGACSSDELARETPEGGVLTRQLIHCLTGKVEIQTTSPFLDLMETGAVVCQQVRAAQPDQKPIRWGLSLFGRGRFARNPHFDSGRIERRFPVESVLPLSTMGCSVRLHSSAIWTEYRSIADSPSPRRLLDILDQVLKDGGGEPDDTVAFLQGIGRTLSAKASDSTELLARSQCLATCALSVLPKIETEQLKTHARQVLREIVLSAGDAWKVLLPSVINEPHALLSDSTPMANLYYLPMRVVKLLGWIGLSTLLETLLPDVSGGGDDLRWQLAAQVVERYEASIVSVSDEQAPSLYVFVKACLATSRRQLAEKVVNLCYASLAQRKGNVTRVGTDGAQALRYILSIGQHEYSPEDWRPANPSQLLAVILLAGARLGLGSAWHLGTLDRKVCGFFIPEDYRDFGRKLIERGMNCTHRIGFGVWCPHDFHEKLEQALEENVTPAASQLPKEGAALCTVASLLFPDRLPLLLERIL